jgi:hypothetical protein
MAAHICQDCGLLHDMPTAPEESDAVKIARIEAESARELARISARQDKDWNETRVEVAEIEADAEVEAAVAEAELLGAAIEGGIEEQPEPVIIDAPEAVAEEEPEDAPPPAVEGSEPPAPARKTIGLGAW